jgi:hypothetical protein
MTITTVYTDVCFYLGFYKKGVKCPFCKDKQG